MEIAASIIALPILCVLAIFLVVALATQSDDQDQDNSDFISDPIDYTQAGKLHPGRGLDKR